MKTPNERSRRLKRAAPGGKGRSKAKKRKRSPEKEAIVITGDIWVSF